MCNNIKVIFHNIRYGKLYPMDPMSTLQSNLNMSLIYNLRTGNIIVDSLISVLSDLSDHVCTIFDKGFQSFSEEVDAMVLAKEEIYSNHYVSSLCIERT